MLEVGWYRKEIVEVGVKRMTEFWQGYLLGVIVAVVIYFILNIFMRLTE